MTSNLCCVVNPVLECPLCDWKACKGHTLLRTNMELFEMHAKYKDCPTRELIWTRSETTLQKSWFSK